MENLSVNGQLVPTGDHGLNAIGGFQVQNQQLLDRQWFVPPAHG